MAATFEIDGQQFMAFNGGPHHKLSPAVSLFIDCADQAEADGLWEKLLAGGGHPDQCGWLQDRFGLSWQVIPRKLKDLLSSPDRERAGRAMQAMLQMSKIDIAAMQAAYDGR
jgi:predicted 3-demethylubiquinone-9 3-methyltransferase (glyoxalase superfamily)